jgi:hypothetical protein
MSNPLTLAITLPKGLFDSAQAQPLAPVVSASYTPADYAEAVRALQASHSADLEELNRAGYSGRGDVSTSAVNKMIAKVSKFHEEARKQMPVQAPLPVLGRGTTLKTKTQKLMNGE